MDEKRNMVFPPRHNNQYTVDNEGDESGAMRIHTKAKEKPCQKAAQSIGIGDKTYSRIKYLKANDNIYS